MNSAKEPAEQQPVQPMDTEAASKIELYENKRRFFEIQYNSEDLSLEILLRWFKDNWNHLTDETQQHFHDLLLHASESISNIQCMHDIFFTYKEVDGSALEWVLHQNSLLNCIL